MTGAGTVIGAVLRFARQVKSGTVRPSFHDRFTTFLLVYRLDAGSLNRRKCQSVALLDFEHGVMTKDTRCPVLFLGLRLVLRAATKLFEENNRGTLLAFSDGALES